jgi:hypothetical protein
MKFGGMKSMWFGFDVVSESGRFPRPQRIEFWKDKDFESLAPESPFHYKADALLGLALYLMNPHWKSEHLPEKAQGLPADLWRSLDPHHELVLRAQPRVLALRQQIKAQPQPSMQQFSRAFSEVLTNACGPHGFDLEALAPVNDLVEALEGHLERPLLYDFSVQFDPETRQKLHWLHSVLFHVRTLIAMDCNAYIQDAAHDAIKVDSITDYLARGEYVANDALLYWNFKRLREQMSPAAAEQMEKAFVTYSHNGAYLIESLPKSFLNALKTNELEETLYLVQMDWLLGTDAGLLFRIREELYGLSEGYDKIFWTDHWGQAPKVHDRLSVQCEVSEKSLLSAA